MRHVNGYIDGEPEGIGEPGSRIPVAGIVPVDLPACDGIVFIAVPPANGFLRHIALQVFFRAPTDFVVFVLLRNERRENNIFPEAGISAGNQGIGPGFI